MLNCGCMHPACVHSEATDLVMSLNTLYTTNATKRVSVAQDEGQLPSIQKLC